MELAVVTGSLVGFELKRRAPLERVSVREAGFRRLASPEHIFSYLLHYWHQVFCSPPFSLEIVIIAGRSAGIHLQIAMSGL